MADSFHSFSRLPVELRIQIWRHALPIHSPAVFFFKKGLWAPRWIHETDPTYHPDSHIDFDFRHDGLSPLCVPVPLAAASHEAYEVAVSRAAEKGLEMHLEGPCPFYARCFDLDLDTLYIAADQVEDFLTEPYLRSSESDMVGQGFSTGPMLKRIALPEEACSRVTIAELREWFIYLSEIAAVVTPAQLDSRERWEMHRVLGGTFVWDSERGRVENDGGTTRRSIQSWVEEYNKDLAMPHIEHPITGFTIQSVAASILKD